jgi:hypothetical protein
MYSTTTIFPKKESHPLGIDYRKEWLEKNKCSDQLILLL